MTVAAVIVYTITGGTGEFSAATGTLTESAFIAFTQTGVSAFFSGSGQITGPNLTPEPSDFGLMAVGMLSLRALHFKTPQSLALEKR